MNKNLLKDKLKKYLFFVSIVFFSITLIHLIYSYTYFDSIKKAQKGGTISESFVGKFPSLNPLKYYNDDYNNYINHILYRSLSTYDLNKKTIVSDLAECDISNTMKIECNLTKNIKWSSGDNITTEDIKYTYDTIKKYNTNPVLKNILDNIAIKTTDTSITFTSNSKDISILNILFQPILPKSVLENLGEDEVNKNFSAIGGIYSGNYIISKISDDKDSGNMKIFLVKNEMYIKNPVYIENIILKFYNDYASLLKQKNNINIFLDKNHIIGNSIPKLKENKYILPQYVGLFINKDKLEYPKLRSFILNQINKEKLIEKIGKQNNKVINSLFLNDIEINITKSKTNLKTMLNSLGYFKKDYFLTKYNLILKNPELYSKEANIIKKSQTGSLKKDDLKVDITKIKNSITKENYNSKSKTITSPDRVDKYNFITNPNIDLVGKIEDNNIEEILINNEKANYTPGEKEFSYKLKLGKNIKSGENNYKIYFVKNGKKELKDDITFFYSKSKQTLKKNEIDLITKLINQEIDKQKKLLAEKKKKTQENKKIIVDTNESSKIQEKIKEIQSLENNFYYNKNLVPYSLNLTYVKGSEEIMKSAIFIKESLEKAGIKINLREEKIINIAQSIKDNKETYELLLAGINLSYFPFDLSKYFYSGQIDKGQNFAKARDSKLDDILEELNSSYMMDKKIRRKKEIEVSNIVGQQAFFSPLYSPYYTNLVLKNIEGYSLPEQLPKHFYRFNPIKNSYILKEKVINKENKSIKGFFGFLINKLFNNK